ncbi:N(2)-citryl-N(6)-acetyl-N(6)-hydroxylysine synthase [Pseudovibrio axinellae]|uniref:N(2)-citryl-N(6)-acetyl-N(6)-hydroxylysine synthase n=1 Tax=Pseudovibrio axinellae TaxID=989403 RepID=A0A165UPK2_9HYPH|nr:IucA/IucC family protein [Pseudovibrio axinellae]KZL12663.1 N(2)-citryl-N(6)-acetyl-N(6)-hydroxylysine synthase [Pseudovibrio axinellae]SEP62443.1 N2-citryl-N6-acetyl-N6-hydroxylysine synthase [Pseudovibrio axinellae]
MNKTFHLSQAHADRASVLPTPVQQAEHATTNAFLNALLREWSDWWFLTSEQKKLHSFDEETACLPLADNTCLLVRIPSHTAARFEVQLPLYHWSGTGDPKPISPINALTLLATDKQVSPGEDQRQLTLLSRILDSHQGQIRAYEFEAKQEPSLAKAWNFQQAEQALVSGHPTHPNPRSRDELSTGEAAFYAPELQGRFPLFWVLAHRSILASGSGVSMKAFDMCRVLAKSDETLPESLCTAQDDAYVPVPWHPWQAKRLLAKPQVIEWLQQGLFKSLGCIGLPFAATASMRGVHAFHAPYMLKYSLSMRITNSKRVLARKEVERGVQMAELLSGDFGTQLGEEFPAVTILTEPGYVALRAPDGGAMEDSFVILRDNLFRKEEQGGAIMLASLCEPRLAAPSPLGELICNRAVQTAQPPETVAKDWLTSFMQVAIMPLLEIRAKHGLLFGSHQQNMMVGLSDGIPSHLYIRDCQGTGHLTTHHDNLASFLPEIGENAENVVPPELGDELLCYYVIVNNLLHTVSTLVFDGLIDERYAYDLIRKQLKHAFKTTSGDPAFYEYLLTSPQLVSKGNYRTSLSGVNEASGDGSGQLAAFLKIDNPFLEPKT